jgi:hypothetical protein
MKRSSALPFFAALGQKAHLKALSLLAAAVTAAAISVGGIPFPAQADPFVATLPVSVSGPTTVLEGTRNVEYTFAVNNNTGHDLNITSAFALIKYVSDDNRLDSVPNGIWIRGAGCFHPVGKRRALHLWGRCTRGARRNKGFWSLRPRSIHRVERYTTLNGAATGRRFRDSLVRGQSRWKRRPQRVSVSGRLSVDSE